MKIEIDTEALVVNQKGMPDYVKKGVRNYEVYRAFKQIYLELAEDKTSGWIIDSTGANVGKWEV